MRETREAELKKSGKLDSYHRRMEVGEEKRRNAMFEQQIRVQEKRKEKRANKAL